jgi:hypothetical protein
MMLMPFVHRYPRLLWPMLAASFALIAAGAMLLIS